MPPWLRNLMVALLTGFCTGCGSGGLFWVDDKLSKFSAPPRTDVARSNTGWKDVPASRPTSVAAVLKEPISSPRDEDRTLVAPPKLTSSAKARAAEPEPIPQRPLPINEEQIPPAFALATPRSMRGDRIPALDAPTKKPVASDLNPSEDAGEGTKTSVMLASHQRKEQNTAKEAENAEESTSADISTPRREESTPPKRSTETNSAPERSAIQSAPAKPIPRATSAPQSKKLQLANIALCTKIVGFGKVEGTKASLPPGGQALVYVEVSGRGSKRTGVGVETRLNGKLRLTPNAGGPTTEWVFPNIVDVSPSERNEFFCFMTLQLPDSLSDGQYRLDVVVEDVYGGATASEETSLLVERSTTATK